MEQKSDLNKLANMLKSIAKFGEELIETKAAT